MLPRSWTVGLLLLGSGLCALVYQTVWLRELRHIFGSSTPASAAVLAIFMGGLGLGGALLGGRAERSRRPLALYAHLELLIAVSAAASPLLVWLAGRLYVAMGGTLALGLGLGSGVRLVLSAAILALPTVAMGGTLPAAARAVQAEDDVRRGSLALLYGMNALGAVVGTLGSTFFLLETLGTRGTLWAACGLNVAVALVARAVARRLPELPPGAASAPPQGAGARAAPRALVLAAAAVSGFVFLLMELVWYRMLAPLLGGSTFTFGLILAVALGGIALGGLAYSTLGRSRPATLQGFALSCAAEALAIAVPFWLGDRLAALALLLRSLGTLGFGGMALGWAAVTALVVLPAAFIAGVQFPLLIALLGRGRHEVGRQVGHAYAWNTVGSIAGSLAGGFGLLPLLTAPGAWRLVIATLVATALAAAVVSARREAVRLRLAAPLALGALALVLAAAPGPGAAWRHSGIGGGRAQLSGPSTNALEAWASRARWATLWEADGIESSVALVRPGTAFLVNGKSDGHALRDAHTQVMSGMLGALLHPRPLRALVVGLGTGSTAGWLAAIPSVERVDVVEIEPVIAEVARVCAPVNRAVLDNPKVRLIVADAREVLLTTPERYDVVFSEPSNPYRAGVASLFTREFYEAVRSRLSDGGLLVQFLQAYEVDTPTLKSVFRTVRGAFGAVQTWHTAVGDLLLVASREPLALDVARVRARAQETPYREALWAGWRTAELEGVLAHFVADDALAAAIAREPGPINTDDRPLVEFGFARSVGRSGGFGVGTLLAHAGAMGAQRPVTVGGPVDWDAVAREQARLPLIAESRLPPDWPLTDALRERAEVLAQVAAGQGREALQRWHAQPWEPRGAFEEALLGLALAEAGQEAPALALAGRLRPEHPAEAAALVARLRASQGRLAEAAAALEEVFALHRRDPWPLSVLMADALGAALEVGFQDGALATRLFQALEGPFVLSALEDVRAEVRLRLSGQAEGTPCVAALDDLEPHVPWAADVLTFRRDCYEAHAPARLALARRQLERFLAAEPLPFQVDAPDAPRASPGSP